MWPLLLAFSQPADAFCGTYVGPVGSTLENHVAQVALAHFDGMTTLTVAGDVAGDTDQFALVIPVPEALSKEDVTLASPDLFAQLDAYSAPRVVSYTCDDVYGGNSDSAETGSSGGGGEADGVVVEAEFTVGAYTVFVLSAEGADGLLLWLEANGFALPETAAPIVQEYLDAGQHFVAARVDLDKDPASPGYLEPLQFHYGSSAWALPIRIGTTVSPGVQDLVVYAIADQRTAIANYPEARIEEDCMIPEGVTDYAAFYQGQLDAAFATGIWFTEYAWTFVDCDPCSGPTPNEGALTSAGATDVWSNVLTRLRLRYTPEQAGVDLAFYAPAAGNEQVRYIEYVHELESTFRTCGVGVPEDPGVCDEQDSGGDSGDTDGSGGDTDGGGEVLKGGCSCATGAEPAVAWAALGLAGAALLRRRR